MVVVTYFPVESVLMRLIDSFRSSGASIILVDNTPGDIPDVFQKLPSDLIILNNHENVGIAAAQNIGINCALSLGADVVAFFDQDSNPDGLLFPSLIQALGTPPIGVVAPVSVDARNGLEYPASRFNRFGWPVPLHCLGASDPILADMVISSGSVISSDVFKIVGLMDEGLFIDYVDLDWCIRCRDAGFPIRVIPDVIMLHEIGNDVFDYGPFTTYLHDPVRNYYRLRNAFLLIRLNHFPRLYVLHEILAAVVHFLLQLLKTKERFRHLFFGYRALKDGFLGLRGKLNS